MRVVCLLIFSVLSLPALSQKDLKPGYILQGKDTVKGFIQYREGKSALLKCSFTKAREEQTKTYYPSNITGLGFEGRHFISQKKDTTTLFAEVIVEGKSSLLRIGQFYYVKKDSELVSLEPIRKEIVTAKGLNMVTEDKTYIHGLSLLFSDCETNIELIKAVQHNKLTSVNIEKRYSAIVDSYNKCVNSPSKFYFAKNRKSTALGFYVGVNKNFSDPTSTFAAFRNAKFKSPVQFSAGVLVDYANQRVSQKLHFQAEINYVQASFDAVTQADMATQTYHMAYSSIRIPLGVSYNFTSSDFSPYVRIGATPTFLFNTETSLKYYYEFDKSEHDGRAFALNTTRVSFFGGVGVQKKMTSKYSIFIETRYNLKTNILDNYVEHALAVSSLDFFAGIKL